MKVNILIINYNLQKTDFFKNKTKLFKKNIRQEEFDQWKTVTLNNNKLMKEGGLIIMKLLKGLITNEISVNNSNEFDITRVSSLDYAMLTFKMDEGLQDLIKKYNKVFQEFVSLYKFKLFIYKYLDMKYSPYLIEYYRIVPKYLDDIVRDIIRELKQEYKNDEDKLNKTIMNLKNRRNLRYDKWGRVEDDGPTIFSIQTKYAVMLKPEFFRPVVWSLVQRQLHLTPSPAPSSAASTPEHGYYSD